MTRLLRWAACAAAVPVLLAAPAAARVDLTSSSRYSCADVAYQVHVRYEPSSVRGTLCRPVWSGDGRRPAAWPGNGRSLPRAVVVLYHGHTLNREYWNFPGNGGRYSTLRALAQRGYIAIALDRLGSGESDRPPMTWMDADVRADAMHQVIDKIRANPHLKTRSGKLVVVGHSSGSVLAMRLAASHRGVDGLVTTGFLHSAGPGAALYLAMIHPAAEDARFVGRNIPAGYVTLQPGTRLLWYYPYNAEESVVALDERMTDAIPGGDMSYPVEQETGTWARKVDVPVLAVIGDRDVALCTPPNCPEAADERRWYPASPNVQVLVRPNVAHNIALHKDAPQTTELMIRWLDTQTR
jgi:pimeloyl-ACP methyl ester carboxylesterase